MTQSAGIEPGTHWWKASALTTAPSLLPVVKHFVYLLTSTNALHISALVAVILFWCLSLETVQSK